MASVLFGGAAVAAIDVAAVRIDPPCKRKPRSCGTASHSTFPTRVPFSRTQRIASILSTVLAWKIYFEWYLYFIRCAVKRCSMYKSRNIFDEISFEFLLGLMITRYAWMSGNKESITKGRENEYRNGRLRSSSGTDASKKNQQTFFCGKNVCTTPDTCRRGCSRTDGLCYRSAWYWTGPNVYRSQQSLSAITTRRSRDRKGVGKEDEIKQSTNHRSITRARVGCQRRRVRADWQAS